MAELSETQLRKLINDATAQVTKETAAREAEVFKVGDLREHLGNFAEFGGGGAQAWTISYSTSKSAVSQLKDVAGIGGEAAWTISYSTSSARVEGLRKLETGDA